MRKIKILIAVVACIGAASCRHDGKPGLPVPKDAMAVVHINIASLTSKLSWTEIRQSSWFRQLSQSNEDSSIRHLLDQPELSGVDLKSDLIHFIKQQGRGGYMTIEGRLKDPAAFERTVKSLNPSAEVKKDGDLSYLSHFDNTAALCWNDKQFFFLDNALHAAGNSMFDRSSPTTYTSDSLRAFAHDLTDLKTSNSLDDDDRFASLLKEEGDVHVWLASDQYINMAYGFLDMMKISSLIRGSISTWTLNFDKGRITGRWKQYVNDEMKKLLADYHPGTINDALINRAPAGSLVVMAGQTDPKFIGKFLQAAGLDGLANSYFGHYGSSLNEMLTALNGKFLFAASPKPAPTADSVGGMSLTWKSLPGTFLFAASVQDRTAFDKLMRITQNLSDSDGPARSFSNKLSNDWFAMGNSAEAIDQFIGGQTTNQPFAGRITGHPFGLYADLQGSLKTWQKQDDHADSLMQEANVAMWKDLVATGGEVKDGVITIDLSVNLVDGATNSLKQLNAYAEKMNVAQREKFSIQMKSLEKKSDNVSLPPMPNTSTE